MILYVLGNSFGITSGSISFTNLELTNATTSFSNTLIEIKRNMKKLDVRHFLGIYQLRKKMQDDGITNPSEEVKKFTSEFVEKLSKLPLDEEIKIENHSFFDSSGKLISKIPIS